MQKLAREIQALEPAASIYLIPSSLRVHFLQSVDPHLDPNHINTDSNITQLLRITLFRCVR